MPLSTRIKIHHRQITHRHRKVVVAGHKIISPGREPKMVAGVRQQLVNYH